MTTHGYKIVADGDVAKYLDEGWDLHGNPVAVPVSNPLNPGQGQLGFVQALVWRRCPQCRGPMKWLEGIEDARYEIQCVSSVVTCGSTPEENNDE